MADYPAAMAQLIAARTGQLLDACAVTRPARAGQTPALDAAGNVAAATAPTVYAGPCLLARFKSTGARATTIQPTVNDQSGVPEPRTLKVPADADLRPGDLVTITAAAFSPALAGLRFLVLHEDPRSYATVRAFTVRGNSWQPTESGAPTS